MTAAENDEICGLVQWNVPLVYRPDIAACFVVDGYEFNLGRKICKIFGEHCGKLITWGIG